MATENIHRNGIESPTAGRDWRTLREEGWLQSLPSGNVVRLRPVDLPTMLAHGKIPDLLTPIVGEMIFGKADKPLEEKPEQAIELVELMTLVCTAAFLEPRIVDNPEADDEIHIEDVDFEDRGYVYTLVTQPTRVLYSFRRQQERDVDDLPDDETDAPATE